MTERWGEELYRIYEWVRQWENGITRAEEALKNITISPMYEAHKRRRQPRVEPGWQPLVEGITKLSAVDYSAYYKERGYEVKVLPNKRNHNRVDLYIRKE